MLAYMIDAFETPGDLRDVATPEPGTREVLVRVNVAGVNPVDWKVRAGTMPSLPVPRVIGQDVAGIVERIGEGVVGFAPGDRVVGLARSRGGYAEYTLIGEDEDGAVIARLPEGIDDRTAAALPTPTLTALAALNLLGVGRGSTLAVLGAAGTLGATAVQLAKARGAQVVALVRPEQVETSRRFGAEHTIASGDEPAETVKAVMPGGVDVVLDAVSSTQDALRGWTIALKPGGSLVSTNHAADETFFAAHDIRATNVSLGESPESSREGLDEICRYVLDGTLVVDLGESQPLDAAGDVLDRGDRGELDGKATLAVA